MGKIKSALELALERTDSIKSDRSSIDQYEAKQRGKKLANAFLENPLEGLEGELKKCPKEELEALKQGIFDLLVSQINLPVVKEDLARIEAVGKGLLAVIKDDRFGALYKQFRQATARYIDETAQYDEALRRQYAPKLRQKEEELSRRLGVDVRIDPLQDPEFVKVYTQTLNALRENYQALVDQVREQATLLFGKKDGPKPS
jgi:EAL domain-containing protein (putative c-di-GMP-specific phosphodiesterase class I)